MCTEAVTETPAGSPVIAGLHGLLEALQAVGPELGEEVPQRGEPLRAHHVQAPLAVRADRHQAGVPEHLQVLGNGLLGDVEPLGDLVDRARPVAHQPQDVAAARLGEGLERGVAHETQRSTNTRFDLYKRWLVAYTSLSL